MTNPHNEPKQREPGQPGQSDQHSAQPPQAARRNEGPGNHNPAERSHMNEGIEGAGSAASIRRGGRDPQYGTNPQGSRALYSPKTVRGSTDEAPDDRGEQSTDRERDLTSGRK